MTPIAYILGQPLSHSLSPLLHGHWLQKYGLKGHYVPVQLPAQALEATITAWRGSDNIQGGNVTLPHKKAIMPLLDVLTPLAKRCGAVNTIIRQADGRWLGHNTDGLGLVADMQAAQYTLAQQKVLLLGAGGAAAGLIPALLDAGAHITLYNRTIATAHEVAQHAQQHGDTVTVNAAPTEVYDMIINTMTQSAAACAFLSLLRPQGVVYDINYGQTPLLHTAAAQQYRVRDGLGMLLHQAVPGFAAWFGHTPSVTPTEEALLRGASIT